MLITKRSSLTGKTHTMDIPVDVQKFNAWDAASKVHRPLVQVHFPELSKEHREFIVSGITPDEWNTHFNIKDK